MNENRYGPVILADEYNWSWGSDPKTHHLFLYLLQKATPAARTYRDAILHRGDVYITIRQLTTDTGLSAREIRTALDHMLKSGDIVSSRCGRNRVLHLTRYDQYVSFPEQEKYRTRQADASLPQDSSVPDPVRWDEAPDDSCSPAAAETPDPVSSEEPRIPAEMGAVETRPHTDTMPTGTRPLRDQDMTENRTSRDITDSLVGGYRGACYSGVKGVYNNSVVNSGEEREKGVSLTLTPFSHTLPDDRQQERSLPGNPQSGNHLSRNNQPAYQAEPSQPCSRPREQSVQPQSSQPRSALSSPVRPRRAEGFDEFWAVYPRKTDKARALRAWNELSPDAATRVEILKSIALMAKSDAWKIQNGRFIPYPANWLSGRRWEDDPAEARRSFRSETAMPIQAYKQRDYSEELETPEEMLERLKRGVGVCSA